MNFEKYLITKARGRQKTIVFPEAGFSDRIVEAARIVRDKGIAKVILVGDESSLVLRYKNLEKMQIRNRKTDAETEFQAEKLYDARKEKGMTKEDAEKAVLEPIMFGTMLVKCCMADGMVSVVEVTTAQSLKPALQVIKGKDGLVSSTMLLFGKNKFLKERFVFLSDPALVENPTSEGLAMIAKQTAKTAVELLNITPRVAFLSYSTKGSAEGESITKVRNATEIFRAQNPDLMVEGELQFDSAMCPEVRAKKASDSLFVGQANILIVPDINVGNILYKAMQYVGGLTAVGPIMQGFNKPVNDLSRGASVKDIVLQTAITVLQCK